MKQKTSLLKRCLALALALVLLLSNANLGVVLRANAAGDEKEISVGKLIAKNYELSDAEKALLESGYLTGDEVKTYKELGDDLVEVDFGTKTITAKVDGAWIPTGAQIMVGEGVAQDVELTLNGEEYVGTHTYAEKAYSVKVTYELAIDVGADVQTAMLAAAGHLKQAVANMDAVKDQAGNLLILETAMPELVKFASNGVNVGFNFKFSEEVKTAIHDLDAQRTANGGKLNLTVEEEAYQSGSKTEYLLSRGSVMQAEVKSLLEKIELIKTPIDTLESFADMAVQSGNLDATTRGQIKTLHGVVNDLVAELEDILEAGWHDAYDEVITKGDATLDGLVKALGTITAAPTVKTSLKADSAVSSVNMSMCDVSIVVELQAAKNAVDSDELEVIATDNAKVLTLDEGVVAADVIAQAQAYADAVVAGWTDYDADAYQAPQYSALPETLTENVTLTITYEPKEYTLNYLTNTKTVHHGYQVFLENHTSETNAYDYTVNGAKYAQGTVYKVVGDTTITRSAGKSYTKGDLYGIITGEHNQYGNEKLAAILTSGAVKGNEDINVRYPDKSILTLKDKVLTALADDASYNGLLWKAYSYGANGNENLFSGETATWENVDANVIYRLDLDKDAKASLDRAVLLANEAKAQKSTLDRLNQYTGQMEQITNGTFGALVGMLPYHDFTTVEGIDTAEESKAMQDYFIEVLGRMLDADNPNCAFNGSNLKLYDILRNYNNEGLSYYYKNYASVIAEIDVLSAYLDELLATTKHKDALESIMVANGVSSEMVSKLDTLKETVANAKAALTAPNAAIDLNSDKLSVLVAALNMEGDASYDEFDNGNYPLYLYSSALPVTTSDMAGVSVTIEKLNVAGELVNSATASITVEYNFVLTEQEVASLNSQVATKITELFGTNTKYYTVATPEGAIDELVGKEVTTPISLTYSYTPKNYTVKIEGEAEQSISIDDLTIDLPAHPNAADGYVYIYTINGKEVTIRDTKGNHTFALTDLDALFATGSYTIDRSEKNEKAEAEKETLNKFIEHLNDEIGRKAFELSDDRNKITANLGPNDMMGFMMGVAVGNPYSYVGLNNEAFVSVSASGTEVVMQTFLNAVLSDTGFSNERLIAIAKHGNGTLTTTTIQLGNNANDVISLGFDINLLGAPEELKNYAEYLELISKYVKFSGAEGACMNMTMNLPDKVYQAYLTAMLGTGVTDKSNVQAIEADIAFQYMYDYVDLILDSGATTETFTNTLKTLGMDVDLTRFEMYYDITKSALNDAIINDPDVPGFDITVSVNGKSTLDMLLPMMGVDLNNPQVLNGLNLVKEYDEKETLTVATLSDLSNTIEYEALVLDYIDYEAGDIANQILDKFGYTSNLAETTGKLTYPAVVVLLKDIETDLNFTGKTVLDLNGMTVTGNITGKDLHIIDSSMDTTNSGVVTGTISGDVVILSGNYDTDVTAFLPDGYKQDGKVVTNALYTIKTVKDEAGKETVTFVINTDVMNDASVAGYVPDITSMAVDIAVDILLNYYTTAALSVEGNELYDFELHDIIGLLKSNDTKGDTVDAAKEILNLSGLESFVNQILDDLLKFGELNAALAGDGIVASYGMTTEPWAVDINRIKDGDYLTVGVTSNDQMIEESTIQLQLIGENKDYLTNLTGELDEIVETADANLDMTGMAFANKTLTVSGTGELEAVVDLTGNQDYITVLTVILANGNPGHVTDEMVAALNKNQINLVREAFDKMSVEDIFTALKVMQRNVTFADMAANVGVEIDVNSAAALEESYHIFLCGIGAILERLDITGYSGKVMGSLDTDHDGTYVLDVNVTRNPSVTVKGYGAACDATVDVNITFKVFKDGLFDVFGANTKLGSELTFNFFIEKEDLEGEDYYAVVVHHDAKNGDITYIIPYSQWENRTDYMVVALPGMAARQMADLVDIVVYHNDGTQASYARTDSIRDYVMRLLNDEDEKGTAADNGLQTVLVDMLNYGAGAQSEFEYNTENLANAKLTDTQKVYATAEVSPENLQVKGENYYGSTATLKDRIYLTFYFEGITDANRDGMYAVATYASYKNPTEEITIEISGSEFRKYNSNISGVIVDEPVIADGNALVSVVVYNEDGSVFGTASDSINSYAARMMNKGAIYGLLAKFTTSSLAYLSN